VKGCIERASTAEMDSHRSPIAGRTCVDRRPMLVPGPMDVDSFVATHINWYDKDGLAGYAGITMMEVA